MFRKFQQLVEDHPMQAVFFSGACIGTGITIIVLTRHYQPMLPPMNEVVIPASLIQEMIATGNPAYINLKGLGPDMVLRVASLAEQAKLAA